MEVILRPARPEDLNFILSTWLRNYRNSSFFARSIRTSVFYEWHHKLLAIILSRPSVRVTVACDGDDPQLIFGYLVSEQQGPTPVAHYIYVKRAMRGFGLGKKLMAEALPENQFEFTHLTVGALPWHKKNPQCLYNPYRVG